jgi:hypothetical protein
MFIQYHAKKLPTGRKHAHTKLFHIKFRTYETHERVSDVPSLSKLGPPELEQLIKENIPRDALMAFDDACRDADRKCIEHAKLFVKPHRSSGAGQNRHFFMNESIHEAFTVHGANPTHLSGAKVVVGRLGIFNLARQNVSGYKWQKLRNSKTRSQLAQVNDAIEQTYVQPSLIEPDRKVHEGTIFLLCVMDGWDADAGIAKLTQVMIALPAPDMESWLYTKPLTEFLKLYDLPGAPTQPDGAEPKLKVIPKKQTDDDQGN